uniref:Uncharacterized protein n=1 Tax=Spermophilus dauricus TaxID=99837 RepID=A0A8C9Q446_SPEDA
MVTQGCSYYHIMIFSAMFGTCSQYSKQNFFSFAMLVVVEEISLDKNDLGKHWKGRSWKSLRCLQNGRFTLQCVSQNLS